jgi:hypothetical protein
MGDLVYIHRSKEKWIDIKEEPLPNEEFCLLFARGTADAPIMELLSPDTDKQITMSFLSSLGIRPLYWMRVPEPPMRGKKEKST